MSDSKTIERRRSALYRMAGNIASGFLAAGTGMLIDEIASLSADLAEKIAREVDERNPMPETEQ